MYILYVCGFWSLFNIVNLNQPNGFVYLLSFQDFIFPLDDFCSMVNAQFIIKMITLFKTQPELYQQSYVKGFVKS